ncbi:hypothetical protein ORI94_27035 [Streptomyces sp. NEAU-W12]|nr:hypothetical protein [Streptomyces sp. NEAU-W12]MCX2927108.1 hypothetical protein [Streptomyces sp. NEAU-W12]
MPVPRPIAVSAAAAEPPPVPFDGRGHAQTTAGDHACDEGRQSRGRSKGLQSLAPGKGETGKEQVAGHEGGEDLPQAEKRHGVDDPGDGGHHDERFLR